MAPSGTCFERFLNDAEYRLAITTADLVLPDSGFMVMLCRLLRGWRLDRISGLAYFKTLLVTPEFKNAKVFWVLPNEQARVRLLAWATAHERPIAPEAFYVAPRYSPAVTDEILLRLLQERRPDHVVIGIGAGPQEKLGWFLRKQLSYRPAIHCIGGALGFVTGDQVAIPDWADRCYLGWFLRLLNRPRVFVPRLWKARLLPGLILRYGKQLPPLRSRPIISGKS